VTYVTRVEGNVKGEFAYDLSPCTLIVGKNASGKSRAADAIGLALTGRAVSEGIGKREVDLLALAPPGAGELRASVTLSSGETGTWVCKGTTAKATRPEWSGERGALLMDEAIGLLRSDAAKLRAALLSRLGGSVTASELQALFPAALWPRWAAGREDIGEWSVDMIMEAADSIGERLKKARAQKKLVEAKLAEGITAEPLSDEEVGELNALSTAAAQQGYSADEIARMRDQAELLERSLVEARTDVTAREAEVQASTGVSQATVRLIALAKDITETTMGIVRGHGKDSAKCPVCATQVPLQALETRHAEILTALETVQNAQASAQGLASALHVARNHAASLETQLTQVKRALSHATLAAPVDRARLAELQARVSAASEYMTASTALGALTVEEGELETLKKLSADVISKLLDSKVDLLQKKVKAALPRGMDVEIALRDGNRKICRVALRTGPTAAPRDFRALSGAERAILVSAFASALLAEGEGVRLIIIDDVWFDTETMRSLMESLARSVQSGAGPSQVIVNAVTWHGRTKVPAGWTMVRIDEEGKAQDEV